MAADDPSGEGDNNGGGTRAGCDADPEGDLGLDKAGEAGKSSPGPVMLPWARHIKCGAISTAAALLRASFGAEFFFVGCTRSHELEAELVGTRDCKC